MTKKTATKAEGIVAAMRAGAKLYQPNWRDHGQLIIDDPANPKRLLVRRVSAVIMKHLIDAGAIRMADIQLGRDRYDVSDKTGT